MANSRISPATLLGTRFLASADAASVHHRILCATVYFRQRPSRKPCAFHLDLMR